MRVNTENLFTTLRIETAIALVLKNANKELKELINKTPIIITTEMLSPKHHGYWGFYVKDILSTAIVYRDLIFPKIDPHNVNNLVVLNLQQIAKQNINDEELASIIAHEFGHIFNRYPEEVVPPIGNGIELKDQKAIKDRNYINSEFYADDFAKKLGLGKQLISCLKKIARFSFSRDRSTYIARINKLRGSKRQQNPNQLFFGGFEFNKPEPTTKRSPKEEKIFLKELKERKERRESLKRTYAICKVWRERRAAKSGLPQSHQGSEKPQKNT